MGSEPNTISNNQAKDYRQLKFPLKIKITLLNNMAREIDVNRHMYSQRKCHTAHTVKDPEVRTSPWSGLQISRLTLCHISLEYLKLFCALTFV